MSEHEPTPSGAFPDRQAADALDAGMFAAADPRHLAVLCEHTPNFVACVAGPHHVCTRANLAFRRLVDPRDPVGRPLFEAVPEWNGQKIAFLLDDARNRRERIADHGHALRLRREDGAGFDTLHIHLILVPVTGGDGAVEAVFIVGIDITAHQRSHQDLLESTERTTLALRGAGDGAWDMSPVTRRVVFSPRWKEILGYREDDVGGTIDFWQTLVHPEDLPGTLAALDACLSGNTAGYSHEHRMRCGDGSWKWVLARGVVVARDDEGRALRVTGTMTDISENRLLTDRLRQSHELLKNLSEQVPGALFQFHLSADGHYTMPFASGGMRDMFEVEPEEAVAGSERMLPRVHPEDRRDMADSIIASGKTLQPWSHEFRVLLPRQGLRWRLGTAHPERREDGSVLWHGFMADITERKRIEEELARLALIARKITTAVLITDAEGRIEWVNEAFTVLTGYTVEEVTGRKPGHFLQGPDTDPSSAQLMREAVEAKRGFELDVVNYHKSGRSYWQHIKADPVYDRDGNVAHFISIQSDVTQRIRADRTIWEQANYDTLTGLPNRRLFRDRLELEVRKSQRTGMPMALLFIDLDRFKEANDLLGHDAGDMLLRQAAQRIGAVLRASDTVARLGGDEFTVILAELREVPDIEGVAGKILDTLRQPFHLGNEIVYLSASIGVTLYPKDADGPEEMVRNADQAMYVSKGAGRNRFSYFTPSMREQAHQRLRLTSDLREALGAGQMQVYFQPIVDLASGSIVKAEALLRWAHPTRGLVMPAEFIPLAEESGMIVGIGDWVFREAAYWAQRWRNRFGLPLQISVNKSPVQFLSHDHVAAWPAHLRQIGLPWHSISVEITEGVLLNATDSTADRLLQYRDAGIQVAIDDFGTGYSSMAYLKKFNIDYLKIDQSFVRDIGTDHNARTIAETIILMAHKLGLKVIAEGIETVEQKRMLADAGCDFAQGFLFSEAVPPEQFEAMLAAGPR